MSGLVLLIVVLAAALLLFAVISGGSGSKKPRKRSANRVGGVDREFVARKWAEIETKAGGGALVSAVSEADKLLDYALKQSGVRGETMGERLKQSGGRFSDINAIWSAHKLRNTLAHEAEFDLVPSVAKEAIASFRRGLQDLGAL
jgi:hypothetical protein